MSPLATPELLLVFAVCGNFADGANDHLPSRPKSSTMREHEVVPRLTSKGSCASLMRAYLARLAISLERIPVDG